MAPRCRTVEAMPAPRLSAVTDALRRLGGLVLVSALAGVLVAGLVLPLAGLTGVAARNVANAPPISPAKSRQVHSIEQRSQRVWARSWAKNSACG